MRCDPNVWCVVLCFSCFGFGLSTEQVALVCSSMASHCTACKQCCEDNWSALQCSDCVTWRCGPGPPTSPPTAPPTTPTAEELTQNLQPVIDEVSHFHNVSFSVGIRSASTGTVVVHTGLDDRRAKTRITNRSLFPMGSVTKSFTATFVMQLYQRGLMDIDAPIERYVDPILSRLNGTTLLQLWNNDTTVHNVTARLLLGMRAGLHDYSDKDYAHWTFTHPNEDWSPFDMLRALRKDWVCKPGTCGEYASPGYDLIGLALANVLNVSAWEDLDQYEVIPTVLRSKFAGGLAFPGKGHCSKTPGIVHQYRLNVTKSPTTNQTEIGFWDIMNTSCLNGWTCGNIAASVRDIAEWYYDLFQTELLVNTTTRNAMLDEIPLSHGWSPGLKYGLGMNQIKLPASMDAQDLTWTIGHGGCDWGSIALMTGFNGRFNFSINVATNSVAGMNCTPEYISRYPMEPGMMYQQTYYFDAACRIYDTVIHTLSGGLAPRLNCSIGSPHSAPANYKCNWNF